MNACASRADHCDPDAFHMAFEDRPSVRWLSGLMHRECLVDTFRVFNPTVMLGDAVLLGMP